MQMVEFMVFDGWRDVGYDYFCIDDCWMVFERDLKGRFQVDFQRFFSGIKYFVNYVSLEFIVYFLWFYEGLL